MLYPLDGHARPVMRSNYREEGVVSTALRVIGIVAILVGLIWIGQGSGYFPYQSSSFMINQMPWVYRGVVVIVLASSRSVFQD